MLILVNDAVGGAIIRNAAWWERLVARIRSHSLDRQLAAGAPPETSAILAVRATILVRPSVRGFLAMTLRRILAEATHSGVGPKKAMITPPRQNVIDASDVLAALLDRLLASSTVSAHGIAKVRILLHDGAGPFYYPATSTDLRKSVQSALDAIDA